MRVLFAVLLFGATAGAAEPLQIPAAAEYSAARGGVSLLVWQGGRVIYQHGADRGAPAMRVFSITKSLVSIGVFRDAKSGGISLHQPAVGAAVRGVRLADLMNQTSGLPPAHREFYSEGLKNKEAVLQRLGRTGNPGIFVYGPSHWEVLAEEILARWEGTLEGWLRKFVPGARSGVLSRWRRDDHGALFFSTGARMNAQELLPAGRAVLDGINKEGWPQEVRSLLASGTGANRMYALGFWLNRGAAAGGREIEVESVIGKKQTADFWRGACLCREAPEDLLAMIGTGGQRVYVVPSRDLVVIRLGDGRGFSDAGFLRRLFGM